MRSGICRIFYFAVQTMRARFSIVVLVTLIFLCVGPVAAQDPAAEEKVLKLEVYLTKEQALELAFPGADEIRKEKVWLTDSQRDAIAKLCLQDIQERRITYFVGMKGGKPMGYMVIDHQIGKNYPITFMVVINPDGTVRDVEVMVYREPHGWEIRFENFMRQFFGKDASTDFRNINSITGATLSVNAMRSGVSRAVSAFKVLFLDKTP
jgi:Na+-translocating ferredoxin:NAD+ oxidoreductase RnfG subunit